MSHMKAAVVAMHMGKINKQNNGTLLEQISSDVSQIISYLHSSLQSYILFSNRSPVAQAGLEILLCLMMTLTF